MRQVRALRGRKEREETGLFFAEGIRIVAEAVQTGAGIEALVVAPDLLVSSFAQELVDKQRRAGTAVWELSKEAFASISVKDGPQGLGALVHQRWLPLESVRMGGGAHGDDKARRERDGGKAGGLGWVALSAVADPGNLGTIMRTSDAVGGLGIILVGPTTDPYDPAATRASMGAIFSQGLVRTSVAEFGAWKRRRGWTVVGTSGAAATDYQAVKYRFPLVLYMGSERQGLSAEERALCDTMVRLPMVGRSDSLNLAVATGVMLYELFSQRRRGAR